MISDTKTNRLDDPERRWAALIDGLDGRRRDAVIVALRNSLDQGYPACAEGVRLLVAYAQGEITSRQYARQMLVALGMAPSFGAPAPPVIVHSAHSAPATWQQAQASPLVVAKTRRQEAVQDFVTGVIPIEEFLRRSRVRTA